MLFEGARGGDGDDGGGWRASSFESGTLSRKRVDDLGLEREKESQKLDNTQENKRECAR